MAKVGEEDAGGFPLQGTLDQGLKALSGFQQITFKKYIRQVLPLDKYVFWVYDPSTPALSLNGSLHYETDQQQRVDETIGINKVTFTTQEEIDQFNTIAGNIAWIGSIDNIRFAFTSRGRKYREAGTFHYRGDAIYPTMYSQIIDNPILYGTLDGSFLLDQTSLAPDAINPNINLGGLIATNSTPIWLGLNKYMPIYPELLVDSNIRPPYAAVEVTDTKPIQAIPFRDTSGSSWQLMTEKVKIIMHGLRNDQAIDFLNYVLDYSASGDVLGVQNMPGIVDDKRGQSELGIRAQKKFIEFQVSYYQARSLQVARQLIQRAGISFAPSPFGILDQNFTLNQTLLAP